MPPIVWIVIAFLLLLLVWGGIHNHLKETYRRQILGLSWLQSMRSMLTHLQLHRGLSCGYLSGRHSLSPDLESLQRQVSVDIAAIASINDWMENNEQWSEITRHWARLAGSFRCNNIENNLLQHNALIQSLLYLIDDMAKSHGLVQLRGPNNQPFSLAWRELLVAAETIGQVRALGMGVSVQGHCDPLSQTRLKQLCHKIEADTQVIWRVINPMNQTEEIQHLLQYIERQVIAETVTATPEEFFQIATSALETLHDLYDRLVEDQRWQLNS